MPRLPALSVDDLKPDQRALLDEIQRGPRGRGRQVAPVGPYGVWLRAPHIGGPTQAFGAAVRFDTKLAENFKEVAICTVGAFYHAKFEFSAHRRLAEQAGVDTAAIEKLRVGQAPDFSGDEAVAYRVANELLRRHRLTDATYEAAQRAFGEAGVIELVTVIGYYCLVSMTLNAFEAPLLPGADDPFPDFP